MKPTYPPDHMPAVIVPKGGSSCASCRFRNGQLCMEPNFNRWNGGPVIPAPVDEFCSDWWRGRLEE